MKLKQKLHIDSDNDLFSPKVLLDGIEQSKLQMASRMESLPARSQTNTENIGDYFISVMEPTNYQKAYSQPSQLLEAKAPETKKRIQSDKSVKSHKNISSKTFSNDADFERIQKLNRQVTKIQQLKQQQNHKSCRLLFEKNNYLEDIIQKQKIKNLKKNFIKKVRRTSTLHPPVEYQLQKDEGSGLLGCTGIEIPQILTNFINILSVAQIITLLVIYSISFVFQDLLSGQYTFIQTIQICSFVFYFIEIVLNLVTVKFAAGKRINIIKDIIEYYIHQDFWIDCISFIILLVDISTKSQSITFFRIFIIFKLPQCIEKIQKIQVYFIRNVYNQQYWELAKVFLVNFCYAHIIGIVLGAMASLSPNDSWLIKNGLGNAPWAQKYVWSVYWATNIMLTVGFGDLSAANHKEAICLIFIQTLSCIVMAYNINRVGSILNNIRLEDQNRSKKFKIFKKLTDQNTVSEQLAFKINNYIQESSKIKKKFNYEEDQQFLKELPDNLKTTFLKQTNKQIFNKLVFFKSLLQRTLYNFSEQLQTRISHPQQIIKSLDDDFNLIILRKGHLGYICKKNGCGFNDSIVDQIKINRKDLPFLTSLDFISKTRPCYEIKSLQFSVLFTLKFSTFIQIFRKSDMDYQLYCFLRDKSRNIPDQFQVKPCQFCQNFNHFKFTCPRLHFVPYQQHVVDKYIHKQKIGKNARKSFERQKDLGFTPMQYYKKVKGYKDNLIRVRTRDLSKHEIANVLQETVAQHFTAVKLIASKQKLDRSRTFTAVEASRQSMIRQVVEEQLIKRQRLENFQDNIWSISLDAMHNFNGYFSKDNPKYLTDKFSRESRIARRKLKFKVGLESAVCQKASDQIVESSLEQNWMDGFQHPKSATSIQEQSL